MIEIIYDNSYSQIKGLNTGEFCRLRKILSYKTSSSAAYYSGGFRRTKYLLDSKGFFPSGLIHKVKEFVTELQYTIIDNRIKPLSRHVPIIMKPPMIVPYKAQLKALDAAVEHEKGCISIPTGGGKSLVIALIASRLNVKTLVVVPTLEIKNQFKETLSRSFKDASFITVENIDSKRLKNLNNFDCLIIDEAHHSAAKTYRSLNKIAWTDIYYRFFLTATPFRNVSEEQILFESIAGEVIYQLSYKDAVKEGYIVPVEAFYIDLPKRQVKGYTWAQVYNELVVNNESRNETIAYALLKLQQAGKSTLCLVKEIQHGLKLSKMTAVEFVNGQDISSRPYIAAFNQKAINALIGTTGILGEGIDTRSAEYIIIAGLGKAKSAIMQQIGRAVRKYPGKKSAKIILFRDSSHKWTLSHFNTQKKILLDEYGIKPLKLEL